MKNYITHDEWCIVENGFHAEHNEITESLMSLGNGRMGGRGNFEETYSGKTLQGNLDPAILLTSPDCIRTHVRQVLAAYGSGCGHVFNLGHGITPDVPVQHVSVLVEAVHEFSPIYHKIAS